MKKLFTAVPDAQLRAEYGPAARFVATVEYESLEQAPYFSITAEVTTLNSRRRQDCEACGCMHDDVARLLPDLAPYIKFHLMTRDAPMHYIATTVYHVKQGKLDWARSTAVWPDATDDDLRLEGLVDRLAARLPALRAEFDKCLTHFFGEGVC